LLIIQAGIELAVLAGLGAWGGTYLDRRWNTEPYLLLAGAGVGFCLGLWRFIREATAEEEPKGKGKEDRSG